MLLMLKKQQIGGCYYFINLMSKTMPGRDPNIFIPVG